jgi:antitoxin component YwqK of YwqJK toxin-antitoxin module
MIKNINYSKKYLFFIFMLSILVACQNNEKRAKAEFSFKKHENGMIKEAGYLLDGKKEGIWTEFSKSGERLREIPYENGLIEGVLNEYREGNLFWSVEYKNNRENGIARYFNRCRELVTKGEFDEGDLSGYWYSYENNSLMKIERYSSNSVVDTVYLNMLDFEVNNFQYSVKKPCD